MIDERGADTGAAMVGIDHDQLDEGLPIEAAVADHVAYGPAAVVGAHAVHPLRDGAGEVNRLPVARVDGEVVLRNGVGGVFCDVSSGGED